MFARSPLTLSILAGLAAMKNHDARLGAQRQRAEIGKIEAPTPRPKTATERRAHRERKITAKGKSLPMMIYGDPALQARLATMTNRERRAWRRAGKPVKAAVVDQLLADMRG